ncbi:MAG TPA: hypothetical protein VL752_03595 [Acidisoma sp.]|uniref:hypothetical protein n=1 Tax=Acidisoma sp. TaxID=1872115 RepID=UPI002C8602C6|nr:hypothetical protein [Acidisoma sp.]HTI00010.1 hypothetical protein [Acidisoma sp.]
MRRIEDGSHLPRPGLCQPVSSGPQTEAMPADLDDRTLDYVLQARPVFDRIGRISGQLSGLLILAATGARSAQGHPMFALIQEAEAGLADEMASLHPTGAAGHHHRHLCLAVRAVSRAVTVARQGLHVWDEAMMDEMTAALRRANQELQWATAALPGFAVVDLRQACCAMHMRS